MACCQQSLTTLRLPTWTSGAERLTRRSSIFNYLDHNGDFYQVCPLPLLVNMNRTDPTEISCMNSAGVRRPSTRSWHPYSEARTGSTSSGRSDTNIIRSRIALKVTCGNVAGVLATRSGTSVCGRTLSSLAQMGSLIFLLDYHGGWSCLPRWEQALKQHQE